MKSQDILYKLQKPQNYTSVEINCSKKTFSCENINVCLVFPDLYEIGMSHQGIKLLYHLLNQMEGVNAERCFLPDRTSIEIFRQEKVPLFSLESKTDLKHFDLIGFSLLSELNFTNVLAILELADIPLLSENRRGMPLIAAGGISAINPEPMRRFIDFFAFGDGEVLFPDIIEIMKLYKQIGWTRGKVYQELDKQEGIYVPSLFPLKREGSFIIPDLKQRKIKKRISPLQTIANSITQNIVPLGQVVFDRLDIEIARGCPNGCRFCQARNYYAPYRAKKGHEVISQIKAGLLSTGFDSVSLASLSTGDHPDLTYILKKIDCVLPDCTSFSLPSLRPRTLSSEMLETMARYRRTGLTIVPEAGGDRLRRVIGKDVTDDEIFAAIEIALNNKWQKIKLYFMIGLPTETDEDILALVALVKKIQGLAQAQKVNLDLTLSFSTFVPKPHTPFQWATRITMQEAQRRINLIKSHLRKTRQLSLDFHMVEKGEIETVLSRGDDRVGDLLLAAYQSGEILSAWDKEFHEEIWIKMIGQMGCDIFLNEIPLHEILPWSAIEINHSHSVLAQEYNRALLGEAALACSLEKCESCHRCIHEMTDLEHASDLNSFTNEPSRLYKETSFNRVRLQFQKMGPFCFFSQLAMQKYIERIIRISGIPFQFSEGFHPRIKLVMLPPLPVFAQGMAEIVEVFFPVSLSVFDISSRLNMVDTPLKFSNIRICNPESRGLSRDIEYMVFSFDGFIGAEVLNQLKNEMKEGELFSCENGQLEWQVNGQMDVAARFGKTYRIIDPERIYTRHLKRVAIKFRT